MTQMIILNGGSSSGKSGIARCLQAVHEGVSYDLEVDTTHAESLACARVIAATLTACRAS